MKDSTAALVAAALCAVTLAAALPARAATDLSTVVRTPVPLGRAPAAVLADFDGDGDGDVVAGTTVAPGVAVLRNDGPSGFTDLTATAGLPPMPRKGVRVAVGDLDGDGDADVVACGKPDGKTASPCAVAFGCAADRGALAFDCGGSRTPPTFPRGTWLPILGDWDGDTDVDLLLLPLKGKTPAVAVRNGEPAGSLTLLPAGAVPVAAPVSDAVAVDADGRGERLAVLLATGALRLLAYQDDGDHFTDQSPLLPSPLTVPRKAGKRGRLAAGDLDGDRLPEVLLESRAGMGVLKQREDGGFDDATAGTLGLTGPAHDTAALLVADFDRDGRNDVFVAGRKTAPSLLFINTTAPVDGVPLSFAERGALAGFTASDAPETAALFLQVAACDHAPRLLQTTSVRSGTASLFAFPDDSTGRTVVSSSGFAVVTVEGGCAVGGPSTDRLEGHRRQSVLDGAGGDDTLVARAGLTVMRGGPGRDTFLTAGATIILLPAADIVAGEVIDCRDAGHVIIDSPFSQRELEAMGVVFEECTRPGECTPHADEERGGDPGSFDDGELHCHEDQPRAFVANLGLPAGQAALDHGLQLDLVSNDGGGFGTCDSDSDCYALGLDKCLIGSGAPPASGKFGRCYPSNFPGTDGSVIDWCRDPYWANYRTTQLMQIFANEGRKLVVPVTFWLPRSSALDASGACTVVGHEAPMSTIDWHKSVATVMNSAAAFYGQWGIVFDYRFRTFAVPADSDFVVDPMTDRCRIDFAPGGTDANSVGVFVNGNQGPYAPGEINAYLSDVAGVSWSTSAVIDGLERPFLLLRGDAGAFNHEIGHGLGLKHPQQSNRTATNAKPDEAESRDSWLVRPFIDAALDRLHVCSVNADCAGSDAGAGDCRKGPGSPTGYCRNLKKDCADDGDHVCDTPWDPSPCFEGIGDKLGEPCEVDDDCNDDSPQRGTSYVTECGADGYCVKRDCNTNADCPFQSMCVLGACAVWETGVDACCELNTDRQPGFRSDVCVERGPFNSLLASPGVGNATYWPIAENFMGYHKPRGIQRTWTDGQRDQVVCRTGYRKDLGNMMRKQKPDDGGVRPCTLRPGGDASTYGNPGETRKVAHGACASGVCQLSFDGDSTTALCVPSTCNDGIAGPGEASVDCGGICPAACPTSRSSGPGSSACFEDGDCLSGVCHSHICQATCEDGLKNGSELSVDSGGVSFDATCSTQPSSALCRFTEDCTGALFCEGAGDCVTSSDCPVNASAAACQDAGDCPNNGTCRILEGTCSLQTCNFDAMCPSGVCWLPDGVCACGPEGECPGVGNTCIVERSMCLGQCVDTRCLGTCEQGLGG